MLCCDKFRHLKNFIQRRRSNYFFLHNLNTFIIPCGKNGLLKKSFQATISGRTPAAFFTTVDTLNDVSLGKNDLKSFRSKGYNYVLLETIVLTND